VQTPSYNQVTGTILAAGTLSSQFDTQGYTVAGLIALDTSVNGTLNFRVSDKADADGGVYRLLYGSAGVAVAVTAPSGQFAITADSLTPLKGYRYVRVASTAQTTGLALVMTLKAE
jgi:hypothetical protein